MKLLLLTFFLMSCSSYKTLYVDGEYESLNKDNHMTPIFNETDWIKVSREFSDNLKSCPQQLQENRIYLQELKNNTSEIFNTEGLKNRMMKTLQEKNKIIFSKNETTPLQLEGEISSIRQKAKDEYSLYYKITYHLVLDENILCTTQVEFRKRYHQW